MKIIFLKVQVVVLVLLVCSGIPANAKPANKYTLGRACYIPSTVMIGACVILPECVGLYKLYELFGWEPVIESYVDNVLDSCGWQEQSGEAVVCCVSKFRAANTTSTTTSPLVTFQPGTVPPFVAPTIDTTPPTDRIIRPIQSNCSGEDGLPGRCINLLDCRTFFERLQNKPDDNDFLEFLSRSNAICQRHTPIVCCPVDGTAAGTTPTSATASRGSYTLPTPEEGCGQANSHSGRIAGGDYASLGSWPWIALFGYRESNGEISWKCGGSLVTTRHIITAAHCINSQLVVVRLGEHDFSNKTETRHVDVAVMKAQRHPSYDRRDGHSDIAIVYLERDIEFTELIRPICLPLTAEQRSKDYVGLPGYLAGWGRTQKGGEFAPTLKVIGLPILSNQQCMQRYRDANRLISAKQFDDKVLCVGVLTKELNSCLGDSGGPLAIVEWINEGFVRFLIGIISYGIGCTEIDVPRLHCNVAAFIDWIQEKVAEPL